MWRGDAKQLSEGRMIPVFNILNSPLAFPSTPGAGVEVWRSSRLRGVYVVKDSMFDSGSVTGGVGNIGELRQLVAMSW